MPDDQPAPDESGAVRPDDPDLAYATAMAELEAILLDLERRDLDVDQLAADVARAAELIRTCRGRIGAARLEVQRIVADLDPDPS